jgi:hypothetical protein
MKMLRSSMNALWAELLFLHLRNKYKLSLRDGISEQQFVHVGNEVWDIVRSCAPKEDSPDKSVTAFYIGWGRCDVTHDQIADILNEQLKRENRLKKPLTASNIKRYLNSIRGKIRKCALSTIEPDADKRERHVQDPKAD